MALAGSIYSSNVLCVNAILETAYWNRSLFRIEPSKNLTAEDFVKQRRQLVQHLLGGEIVNFDRVRLGDPPGRGVIRRHVHPIADVSCRPGKDRLSFF